MKKRFADKPIPNEKDQVNVRRLESQPEDSYRILCSCKNCAYVNWYVGATWMICSKRTDLKNKIVEANGFCMHYKEHPNGLEMG